MSAFIGSVNAPDSNSPDEGARVHASRGGVELALVDTDKSTRYRRAFDPIAARNLAALLVRASEEVERMRARPNPDVTPHVPDGDPGRKSGDIDGCSGGRR